MKDYIHFVSICLLVIGMFFLFGVNRNQEQKIDKLSHYLDKLVKIEIIFQTQFEILSHKVDMLEKRTNGNFAQNN